MPATLTIRSGLRILAAAAAMALMLNATPAFSEVIVNDITQLNPITVASVQAPSTVEELSGLVAAQNGPISIGGGRYSQGGQTACTGCLFIDMSKLDRVLALDATQRTVTVQAGITWRKLQEAVDPKNLSPKIMQSYSNFTVGGSLSVNCHGDYVGLGPIVSSVRAIKLVLADGAIVTASRKENYDLFRAAIGGYGGIGVIAEATLDLAPNEALERTSKQMRTTEYPRWFREHIDRSQSAVLHYAMLYPPDFRTTNAITSSRTSKPVTITDRLAPTGRPGWFNRFLLSEVTYGPFGKTFRRRVFDPLTENRTIVNWRNYDAAADAYSLEPSSRTKSTYVLQEYFVPEASFDGFVRAMTDILRNHKVNVINLAIRHAEVDRETMLSWAPEDQFAFVLYYEQGTSEKAKTEVKTWTSELIAAAIRHDGRHYLPYQIVASRDQFMREYPGAMEFFAVKRRVDPTYKFRNRLWEAYYR